jgi:hypothetical protein
MINHKIIKQMTDGSSILSKECVFNILKTQLMNVHNLAVYVYQTVQFRCLWLGIPSFVNLIVQNQLELTKGLINGT